MFNLTKAFIMSVAMHGLALLVIISAISPLNLPGNPKGERILLVDLVTKKLSSTVKPSNINAVISVINVDRSLSSVSIQSEIALLVDSSPFKPDSMYSLRLS